MRILICLLLFAFWGAALCEANGGERSEVEIFPQLGHSERVTSVAIAPDGKTALSGSFDNTLRLWDLASGREIKKFEGHSRQTLLIFDTCESAAASGFIRGDFLARQTVMEQLQHASGQNLIAGGREAAYEGFEGHGILTAALLEVFRKAATGPAGIEKVDVGGLANYVADRVPEISRQQYGILQDPVRKLSGNDFPVGLKVLPPPAPRQCPDAESFVVTQEAVALDAEAGQQNQIRLPPGYRVGVKIEGERALICRDGRKLGYISKDVLARIQ